jgi:membrane-associated progesterone receptor component
MWRSVAKAAGSVVGGTAVLGFAADYATMSPFRRDWRVGDAMLVGYNQLLRRTPAGAVLLQEFDLAELSVFSGRGGAPTYLAAGGCVWDVSSSQDSFGDGGPYQIFAGRDASVALAYMRIEESDANCVDQFATLRADPEAAESLESWRGYFDEKYRRVGTLREWVRQEPDLTDTAKRCLQRNASRPTVTVLPSGVQHETLAAAHAVRAGTNTKGGRDLSRGTQGMVLAHYCVRRVDGTVVSDSSSCEDGRPLILAVRDLPPVRFILAHDCARSVQFFSGHKFFA